MITTEDQLKLLAEASELLGGQNPTARALGMSERYWRMILSGKRNAQAGVIEDLAKLLTERADGCRRLERLISPAFAANLTERQRKTPHGNVGRTRRAQPTDDQED